MRENSSRAAQRARARSYTDTISLEAIRKSIHLLVALVPVIASFNVALSMFLLGAGTLFYVFAESARNAGLQVGWVSDVTLIVSRSRERGRFVLGPVTLGLGAMLSLMLYPMQASAIAIFSLAFGDSLASLVGRTVGGWRVPMTRSKTLAGSFACFVGIFLLALRLGGDVGSAVAIAASGAALEAYSPDDMDNILLPVGTGFLAWRLLG